MPLKQRSVQYSINGNKLLEASRDAFHKWANRRNNVDLKAIGVDGELAPIGEGVQAQVLEFECDGLEGTRFVHEVTNDGGTYRTELTTVKKANEGWIQVDVHAPRDDARFAPPVILRSVLDAAESNGVKLLDGSLHNIYSPAPRRVKVDEIGQLLDDVVSQSTRGQSVVVAGSDGRGSFNTWSKNLEGILRPTQGLATMWLLDPESTEEYNKLVLEEFQVYPFSIHYFAPGVDTNEPSDSRHHRYFSSKEISQDTSKFIERRIYHLARTAALHNPLPDELKQAGELLRQTSTDRFVASLQPLKPLRSRIKQESLFSLPDWETSDQLEIDFGSTTSQVKPSHPAQRSEAKSLVGKPKESLPVQEKLFGPAPKTVTEEVLTRVNPVKPAEKQESDAPKIANAIASLSAAIGLPVAVGDIDEDHLLELFDLAELGLNSKSVQEKAKDIRSKFEVVQQEKEDAESLVEDLYAHLDEQENELAELRARVAKLWAELKASGDTQEDWADPTEDYPTNMSGVLERLREFEFLKFTGDVKPATHLDDRDNSLIIAKNCWSFMIALESYAKQWTSNRNNVKIYLNGNVTPANPSDFAPSESKTVRETEKYKKERLLPVPKDVDDSGFAYMFAHYRLSKTTGKAARLHFLDDMANTGKIYIGYIGSHLTSPRTT